MGKIVIINKILKSKIISQDFVSQLLKFDILYLLLSKNVLISKNKL